MRGGFPLCYHKKSALAETARVIFRPPPAARFLLVEQNQVWHVSVAPASSQRRRSEQVVLQGNERLSVRRHATPEVRYQATGMRHELRRLVPEHRLQSGALGRIPDRRNLIGLRSAIFNEFLIPN